MITQQTLSDLEQRIQARYSLLFLTTWEEERWESLVAGLALDLGRGLVTWSITKGFQPPLNAEEPPVTDPVQVLKQCSAYPPEHIFLLKDFHPYLQQPIVVRQLRDLSESLRGENKCLLLLGPTAPVPLELQKDALSIDLPLPDIEDLQDNLSNAMREHEQTIGQRFTLVEDEQERMLKATIGLTSREADRALAKSLLGRKKFEEGILEVLISEKKALLRGSEMLEFYELGESINDIGGLEGLKDWLSARSSAYSEKARKSGLPMPKGALLLGVQGCGKSLTARAAARLLAFPLIRLDIAGLLSADQGGSERNLREALRTVESIAPAVLWLDEVEKAFAGVGEGNSDSTMTRLFGMFLTWLQDHGKPIFVLATANSVTNLPPEMLRRGRFDELFFINLPNYHERQAILRIHLRKRKLNPDKVNLELLSQRTEGYSGAELEQVVISAMFEAYTAGGKITQQHLLDAQEITVPLSVTMEEKIFELREWARTRCRPATPDSRVLQMLEEENRALGKDS